MNEAREILRSEEFKRSSYKFLAYPLLYMFAYYYVAMPAMVLAVVAIGMLTGSK